MRRIELFDENMNNVGTLTLDGNGSRYWGMSRDVQIGDADNGRQWQDTLTFSCLADDVNGDTVSPLGYCMWQAPNSHWYLYAIQTTTTSSGTANTNIMTISAANALAYDLTMKTFTGISYKMPTSDTVFRYCLQNSGWEINKLDTMTTGGISLELSGDNAMSAFSSAVTAFKAEVDAYVEYDQYGNLHRYVDIVQHLYPYVNASMGDTIDEQTDVVDTNGNSTNYLDNTQGRTLNYRHGLAGFTRTEDRTQLYTRLHVKGMNDATFADINGGKDWIQDDAANDLWNGGRSTYLEGTVNIDNIAQHQAIMDWGKKQLKIYNHPAFTYEITTAYMDPDDMPERGETLAVVNFDVTPNLTIIAEVFAQHTSDDNPAEDTITLGEIRTLNAITPNTVINLENKINSHVRELINDLRNGTKTASVQLITPTGKSWSKEDSSKTIIARVFVDGTNLTSYLSQSAFIWSKTNTVTGVHDLVWEEKHKDDGYQVTLDDGDVGNITCTIEGDYLKTEAELSISIDNSLFFDKKRVDLPKDHWGDPIAGAFQYQWYDEANQMLVTSVAYTEGTKGQGNRSNADDTKYHRFKLDGTYVDSMVVQGGGHGSSFGAHLVNGVPEIWTLSTDTAGGNASLARFKWVPNTVINQGNGLEVLAKMPLIDGHWFRRIACDFEQGWVLSVMASGPVEVLKVDDLLAGKWNAVYSFKIQQFGFNPVASTEPNFNTMQSNDIHFPYMFINSGDANKKDPRILSCINVVTESEVFHIENQLDMFGSNWVENYFEPETIGYYHDKNGAYVLQGFAMLAKENDTNYLHRTLFKTELSVRDDSGDKKNYIDKDTSGEEENVA